MSWLKRHATIGNTLDEFSIVLKSVARYIIKNNFAYIGNNLAKISWFDSECFTLKKKCSVPFPFRKASLNVYKAYPCILVGFFNILYLITDSCYWSILGEKNIKYSEVEKKICN